MLAVAGDEINMKITTPIDMVMADRVLQMRVLVPSEEPTPIASLAGARLYVVGGTTGSGRRLRPKAELLGARAVVDGTSTGLDVRHYAAVASRMAATAERLGGIDHVVCTAGVLRIGPLVETDPADDRPGHRREPDRAALNVARAAYPYLRDSRGSLTLFTSSSFTRGTAQLRPLLREQGGGGERRAGSRRRVGTRRHPRECDEPGADCHADATRRVPG